MKYLITGLVVTAGVLAGLGIAVALDSRGLVSFIRPTRAS